MKFFVIATFALVLATAYHEVGAAGSSTNEKAKDPVTGLTDTVVSIWATFRFT